MLCCFVGFFGSYDTIFHRLNVDVDVDGETRVRGEPVFQNQRIVVYYYYNYRLLGALMKTTPVFENGYFRNASKVLPRTRGFDIIF